MQEDVELCELVTRGLVIVSKVIKRPTGREVLDIGSGASVEVSRRGVCGSSASRVR